MDDDYAYVAFIDILGYKNMLEKDVAAGTKFFRTNMTEAFRVLETVNKTRFSSQIISDSIFLTCTDRNNVESLLELLRNIYRSFLQKGLLVRGGVSFGEHFQNQTITYSPVLTKAYLLESTVAEYPRIMIDDNIIDMFPNLPVDNHVLASGRYWYLNVALADTFDDLWSAAKSTCEQNRDQIYANEKVRSKHRWLQDYLIEVGNVFFQREMEKYLGMFDDIKLNLKEDATNLVEPEFPALTEELLTASPTTIERVQVSGAAGDMLRIKLKDTAAWPFISARPLATDDQVSPTVTDKLIDMVTKHDRGDVAE